MAKAPMYGPLLKVERADHHIAELERMFRDYITSNIEAMRGKFNVLTGKNEPAKFLIPTPKIAPAVIGDAIHNLRVSLDHAYWIMVENNSGTWHRTIKFPFFEDRPSAEGSLKGQADTRKPRQEVIDFIFDDIEPFLNGKLSLYDLHLLDITDKHQLLLPTLICLSFSNGAELTVPTAGHPILLGGQEPGVAKLAFPTDGIHPFFESHFGPIEHTGDLQNALTILFGDGPLETRPILDTLRLLRQNVSGCINSLEKMMI